MKRGSAFLSLLRTSSTTRLQARIAAIMAATLLVYPSLEAATIVADGTTCSLIDAITSANTDSPTGGCTAGSGADVIELTTDVTLTAVDNTTNGDNGLPSITSEMEVKGVGASLPRTIVRDGGAPDFRIFHVASGGTLDLDTVAISNGLSSVSGGGILNFGQATLTNSTVSGNSASFGGGIYAYYGTVSLTNSTVSGNSATSVGGGIFNYGGTVSLINSTVSGNSTGGRGGGIYNNSGGTVSLINSTVGDSTAARGGGIYNKGQVALTNSTVSNNSVVGDSVSGGYGGGIYNDSGTVSLTNSTVSGNSASSVDYFAEGGGIRNRTGTVSLTNSTVAGNSVVAQKPNYAFGAGVVVDTLATLTVTASLFANSSSEANCAGNGTITDGGSNLSDDTTCGTIPSTLTGLDPTLADNGGPTLTHALLGGSSAIDAAGACGLSTDQRGGGRRPPCDSGAFEALGCELLEIENQTIDDIQDFSTCNTAVLGPDLTIEGPSGLLTVEAGFLVTMRNGFRVDSGAELEVTIDPSLLLPP